MEQKTQQKNTNEINIIPILKVLLSKLWLMILIGVITAGIVYGSTKLLIKPTYRCSFSAYVNNQQAQSDKNTLSNQDLIAAQRLAKTFSHILKSNTILTASLKSIDSDLTFGEINKMVSTEIKDDTELILVYVVTGDPALSYELANAIAATAPKYMSDIVEGSSMKIVDYPEYTEGRYGPSYMRYAIFGFLAGFLLVAVIVLIKYFKDDSIMVEADLETRFTIPVLGVIPDLDNVKDNGIDYYRSSYAHSKSTAPADKGGKHFE